LENRHEIGRGYWRWQSAEGGRGTACCGGIASHTPPFEADRLIVKDPNSRAMIARVPVMLKRPGGSLAAANLDDERLGCRQPSRPLSAVRVRADESMIAASLAGLQILKRHPA
jgi:hypothetical protein